MQERLSSQNRQSRFSQFIKLVCIIGIFPIFVGFIKGLLFEIKELGALFHNSLYWGIASYLLLHIFLIEPLKFYKKTQRFLQVIFGFFSPLFRVSYYIIPFWIIILIILYLILCKVFEWEGVKFLFFFFSGFLFSMHIVCVAKILKVDELRRLVDYLFMILIVLIINVFFFAFNLKLYSSQFSVRNVGKEGIDSGVNLGRIILEQLFIPKAK